MVGMEEKKKKKLWLWLLSEWVRDGCCVGVVGCGCGLYGDVRAFDREGTNEDDRKKEREKKKKKKKVNIPPSSSFLPLQR